MQRQTDQLGRLSIPVEMRRQLGIKNGDMVDIECTGSKIIIKKAYETDVIDRIKSLVQIITVKHSDIDELSELETLIDML